MSIERSGTVSKKRAIDPHKTLDTLNVVDAESSEGTSVFYGVRDGRITILTSNVESEINAFQGAYVVFKSLSLAEDYVRIGK